MERLTTDTLFNGKISVLQEQNGYRFSIDAILLAHFIKPKRNDIIVDLGTGCGVIPLILAFRYPTVKIYGVEIQENLALIAEQNIKDNRMDTQITIVHQDMKTLPQQFFPEPVHIVVCNPPYRKNDSGRLNINFQRAIARHEIKASLADALSAAKRILKIGGIFATIYPAERLSEMISQFQSARIEPKNLRLVYSRFDENAKLVLLGGIREGRPGITIQPPIYIYQSHGSYTDEVQKMFIP